MLNMLATDAFLADSHSSVPLKQLTINTHTMLWLSDSINQPVTTFSEGRALGPGLLLGRRETERRRRHTGQSWRQTPGGHTLSSIHTKIQFGVK